VILEDYGHNNFFGWLLYVFHAKFLALMLSHVPFTFKCYHNKGLGSTINHCESTELESPQKVLFVFLLLLFPLLIQIGN